MNLNFDYLVVAPPLISDYSHDEKERARESSENTFFGYSTDCRGTDGIWQSTISKPFLHDYINICKLVFFFQFGKLADLRARTSQLLSREPICRFTLQRTPILISLRNWQNRTTRLKERGAGMSDVMGRRRPPHPHAWFSPEVTWKKFSKLSRNDFTQLCTTLLIMWCQQKFFSDPVHACHLCAFGRTLHPWNAMQPDSRRVDHGHFFLDFSVSINWECYVTIQVLFTTHVHVH